MTATTDLIPWLLLLLSPALAQTNGYEPDWFYPDIMVPKPDPHDYFVGDNGQPEGQFNWKADQFELMGRAKATCNGCTEGGKHVAIQNLKLFVNDEEFFIKAICYNPVPLGIASMNKATQQGGGGLCSPRRTPHAADEYKSACFDSDFFDGGYDPNREPAGPAGGWFNSLWARDFPNIKSLGANAIRIYNTNPTTYLYTTAVLNGAQKAILGNIVGPSNGKDHRPFMDAAHAAGLMVIFPLFGDETLMKSSPEEAFKRWLMNQIDEIGNHPALLMYTLGNELDFQANPGLLAMVNTYIKFARNYTMSKWGRSIPITHAIVDIPDSYENLYENLDVDIFTSNAGYRGLGFSDLWQSQTPNFPGLGPLSVKYNKPNFIGEFGWEQVNGSQTAFAGNAGWFNLKWKDLIVKGTPAGCIGGAFFEYSDEPFSKPAANQQSMGIYFPRVSTQADLAAGYSLPPPYTYQTSADFSSASAQAPGSAPLASSSVQVSGTAAANSVQATGSQGPTRTSGTDSQRTSAQSEPPLFAGATHRAAGVALIATILCLL